MRLNLGHLFLVTVFSYVGIAFSQSDNNNNNNLTSKQTYNHTLYDCRFSYFPLPPTWTRIIGHHLAPLASPKGPAVGEQGKIFSQKLSYDSSTSEIDLSTIDPNLPFIFFINGFNLNQASLNNTFMEGIADVFEHYSRDIEHNPKQQQNTKYNVIFLKWYVESLFADGLMYMVPTYYKTMANYEIILDYVTKAITKFIDHVEELRGGFESKEARSKYFSLFRFYGHSLGAHIISHAISRIHQSKPYAKFGKLVGLDPAYPCFYNGSLGISADKAAASANQVMIIHSNAGFTGVETPRSPIEIVLNGGTFQPNCHWYDLYCNHLRSTDILSFYDEQCQMVAYRCNKYEQFKLGACETCDQAYSDSQPNDFGCILANLIEQNVDIEELFLSDTENDTRQLADEDDNSLSSSLSRTNTENLELDQLRSQKAVYHYINTNPKFGISSTSHCLQHYQMRLLILNGSPSWQEKCPLNKFFDGNSDRIKLQLLFEPAWRTLKPLNRQLLVSNSSRQTLDGQELRAILADKLYTGLLNYEGKPELFVGAILSNVNFKSWSRCLTRIQGSSEDEFQLVLDMAFMSHVKKKCQAHVFINNVWIMESSCLSK